MKINRVYIGIPSQLKSLVFWVAREFRINDLSFQNGGADIIIEYSNGKVFGYDWIKYPGRYVKKVFEKGFLNDQYSSEIEAIKENVLRIFARKYEADKYETETFIEVWNNKTFNTLPYSILDKYTIAIYNNYLNLFLENIDFAKQYISMHYPFNYHYVITNWSYLETGDAHYCVFLSDTDWIYPSKFGLTYNKNIRWNSKLKARFEYGFDNHFIGYVEGTGKGPVEFDEKDYLDTIIPLDKKQEIESRNDASISYWSSVIAPNLDFEDYENFEGPNTLETESIFNEYKYLTFSEFKTIFEKSRLTALLNESIWENTLRFIIDETFCDKIIDEIKKVEIEKSKTAHNN